MNTTTANNYGTVASVYELLSNVYSGGQILACKRSQLEELRQGDRVLYAGAGGGEDATLAAAMGAQVTVVELSPAMVAEARRRFDEAGVGAKVEIICGSILDHVRLNHYDAVVANFFLNVFPASTMRVILEHLVEQAKPGGKVLISDFAPPEGGALARGAQKLYWGAAVMSFHLLANNPLHAIYDYRVHLDEIGLSLDETRDFNAFGIRALRFRTITATRPANAVPHREHRSPSSPAN